MTTKTEIREWLHEAQASGATHLIVVCDTFDHHDYPVLVRRGEDPVKQAKRYDGANMQKIMEVYALHLPIEMQMAEYRAMHFDPAPAASS